MSLSLRLCCTVIGLSTFTTANIMTDLPLGLACLHHNLKNAPIYRMA